MEHMLVCAVLQYTRTYPSCNVPLSCLVLCRNCIGQQFALKEEKVVLAKILRQFELSPDTSNPPVMMATVIVRAKNGIFLKLKKRNL